MIKNILLFHLIAIKYEFCYFFFKENKSNDFSANVIFSILLALIFDPLLRRYKVHVHTCMMNFDDDFCRYRELLLEIL